MDNMFNGATNFKQDISKWDVTNVTKFGNFKTGSALTNNYTPPKFL
jgi:surface protein